MEFDFADYHRYTLELQNFGNFGNFLKIEDTFVWIDNRISPPLIFSFNADSQWVNCFQNETNKPFGGH